MDEAKLQEIEARADAATPGPWCASTGRTYDTTTGKVAHVEHYVSRGDDDVGIASDVCDSRTGEQSEPNARFIAAARTDVPALVAEVRSLTAALAAMTAERDRLQRACDEGLPREYIECPACRAQHIEGPRHDNPAIDGRKRPHHTHRCYHCEHVWDSGRWSFGADVPKPAEHAAALDAARREGAEGMRAAAVAHCRRVERAAGEALGDVGRDLVRMYVGRRDGAGDCAYAIAALPLDAPGGGS